MEGLSQFWTQSDAIGRSVAGLLLAMSISAWVVIVWKAWVLQRARRDIARAVPAFWSADSVQAGATRLGALDREQVLSPLLAAAAARQGSGTLETHGALDESQMAVQQHLQAARQHLVALPESASRTSLMGITEYLTQQVARLRSPR